MDEGSIPPRLHEKCHLPGLLLKVRQPVHSLVVDALVGVVLERGVVQEANLVTQLLVDDGQQEVLSWCRRRDISDAVWAARRYLTLLDGLRRTAKSTKPSAKSAAPTPSALDVDADPVAGRMPDIVVVGVVAGTVEVVTATVEVVTATI